MNPSKNLIKTNWKNLGLDEFAKHCLGDGIVHLVLQVAATEEKTKLEVAQREALKLCLFLFLMILPTL